MLDVETAQRKVLATVRPFHPELLPLSHADGLALTTSIVSSVDSPPFDKAMMDGFAVCADEVATGRAKLRVVERIMAGMVPTRRIERGEAAQIMTGAPLPEGANAVVKVEETRQEGDWVEISSDSVQAGTNVIWRAMVLKAGEQVLAAGTTLRPPQLAALAELGESQVSVRRRPRVAILATGDELVPYDQTPGPGQIRNSNELMLTAQVRGAGGQPLPLGIARDQEAELAAKIRQGLQADVLVLSGGVSAGQLDLVPKMLAAAGVKEVFHKVEMKPGKPIWFGELAASAGGQPRYVFGLPGNPVSSLVCFELFVRTAIRKLMGMSPPVCPAIRAKLEGEYRSRNDRPTFHPAQLRHTEEGPRAKVVAWQGSSDLRATVEANAMIHFPAGERHYNPGETVEVFSW